MVNIFQSFFVGSGQCSKQLQEDLETEIKNNQEISKCINWPSSHSDLKSPFQQQILEICACCYYIDNDCVPTEILQFIVKKIFVLVHKIKTQKNQHPFSLSIHSEIFCLLIHIISELLFVKLHLEYLYHTKISPK